MTLAKRIIRSPIAQDTAKAADTADAFSDLSAALRELVAATAGCSPYLAGLIEREPDLLRRADAEDLDFLFDDLIDQAASLSGDVEAGLRKLKRQVALLIALADLGGAWSLHDVTGALTRFADVSVQCAIDAAHVEELRRARTPDWVKSDEAARDRLFVVAMGKMGAAELNYSSDIDLICLFDSDGLDAEAAIELRQYLVRVVRRMSATLSDITADGYVFRTDLRLRPDASVTPVVLSAAAAERYYESVGRTWERAAYIKARICAGNQSAGQAYLKRLAPFVWRRHLDFAAIQDAHDMRLRIREHKRLTGPPVLEGHNVKLGSGGIREIEFYTQTRQIISGGRDAALRSRRTVQALHDLDNAGWTEDAESLTEDYETLREIEHRLQMIADQQTHLLPTTDEGFERLASFCGQSVTALRQQLHDTFGRVREITEGFFAPKQASETSAIDSDLEDIVSSWRHYPALRSERAVEIFSRVRPMLLERVTATAKPDVTLQHLDTFMAGLPAGVQLFSLFEANPQLIDLIVDIAATAPRLAAYLSRNASVLDAVLGGGFFEPWPGPEALLKDLDSRLSVVGDYEEKLNEARRWARDWQFRTGVHHLRGLIDASEAGTEYADVAGAICAALWPVVVDEFAAKHGGPPGGGAAVLGMGSLGSRRMSARSDLDLIVVYDAEPGDMSDGRRPLMAGTYYGRLTQAFITALTVPTAEGKLFDVDMRLRPSGRQGPVATSFNAFVEYQTEKAWTWEHMALTRARPVAGSQSLGLRIEAFRQDLLSTGHDKTTVLKDLAEMRDRLLTHGDSVVTLEAKSGPGRLGDISLLAQAAVLVAGSPKRSVIDQLQSVNRLGSDEETIDRLRDADALMWSVQAVRQLISEKPLNAADLVSGAAAFLLRETGVDDIATLEQKLADVAGKVAEVAEQVTADVKRDKPDEG